jgi:hypothetical protein
MTRKLTVTLADMHSEHTSEHETGIDESELDSFGESEDEDEHEPILDRPYEPAKENPVVHKTIEILNGLCKKYKYAVLMKHEVIGDDSMCFYLDYHFNGKEIGTISLEMDKQTGARWTARCYLSVVRAAKLPLTNISMFVADFKKLIQNLHIITGEGRPGSGSGMH